MLAHHDTGKVEAYVAAAAQCRRKRVTMMMMVLMPFWNKKSKRES